LSLLLVAKVRESLKTRKKKLKKQKKRVRVRF
jgi:hypothetical protein